MGNSSNTTEDHFKNNEEMDTTSTRVSGRILVLFLLGAVTWSLTTFVPVFNLNCLTVGYVLLGFALLGYIVENANRKRENDASKDR